MTEPQRLRQQFSGAWARPAFGDDLEPPGSYSETLSRIGSNRSCEIAVIHEHRLAFHFWNRWTRQRGGKPPALVTIDWHMDLCAPEGDEESALNALDRSNNAEVALFAWSQLNPLNDGHILSAAYLGLIGDIYVLCKQGAPEEFSFPCRVGSSSVKAYHQPNAFFDTVRTLPAAVLDIDLDYFTESPDPCGGGDSVTLVAPGKIASLFDPHRGMIAPLLPNVVGMTVALEPEFCGGISNSHRLFRKLNQVMFAGTLLSGGARWKPR